MKTATMEWVKVVVSMQMQMQMTVQIRMKMNKCENDDNENAKVQWPWYIGGQGEALIECIIVYGIHGPATICVC